MTNKMQCAAMAVLTMVLAGCSPKSMVIPSDPGQWGDLDSSVKELSEDDQKLLAQYMARHVVAVAFNNGNADIPAGMTIGKAIEEQKKIRIVQDSLSEKPALNGNSDLITREDIEREISHTVQVDVSSPHVLPEDSKKGRFSEWLGMSVNVQNRSGKTISGIKGVVIFEDVFGTSLSRVELQLNEEIDAGSQGHFDSYGKPLNRFDKNDIRLRRANFSKLRMRFHPEVIAFSDGTRLNTSDVAS